MLYDSFTTWSLTLEAEGQLDPDVTVYYSHEDWQVRIEGVINIDGIDVTTKVQDENEKFIEAIRTQMAKDLVGYKKEFYAKPKHEQRFARSRGYNA